MLTHQFTLHIYFSFWFRKVICFVIALETYMYTCVPHFYSINYVSLIFKGSRANFVNVVWLFSPPKQLKIQNERSHYANVNRKVMK